MAVSVQQPGALAARKEGVRVVPGEAPPQRFTPGSFSRTVTRARKAWSLDEEVIACRKHSCLDRDEFAAVQIPLSGH